MQRLLAAVLAFAAVALAATAATATPRPAHYLLALGDSIAYGFQTAKAEAGLPPEAFDTGFVDVVAARLRNQRPGLTTVNYSCPGESTVSMSAPCVWKASGHALHDNYAGSQLEAAVAFLRAHRGHVDPVTLSLNGNDIDVFVRSCAGDVGCIVAGAPAAIAAYRGRLSAIVTTLRSAAPEAGLVLTGSYDANVGAFAWADPLFRAVNAAEAAVARAAGATFANPFPRFNPQGDVAAETAAICSLTLVCSQGDSHPSDAGYRAIADVVLPGCGSTIAADVTLTRDVTGCPGDGLVIAADGVTLDLAGHAVTETGAGSGVRVDGRAHVTVRDGSVRGFGVGVAFTGSRSARATRLTVTANTGRGISLDAGSDDGRVDANAVSHNGAAGVAVVASARARISGNVSQNDHVGVALVAGARANVVVGNRLLDDPQAGVEITFAGGNTVSGNVVARTSNGVALEGADRNEIVGNRVGPLTGPDGIGLSIYGSRNSVAGNTVTDVLRFAVEVDDFGEEGHTPITGNVVRGNTLRGGTVGIAVGPEGVGRVLATTVSANVVRGFTGDGIAVTGTSSGLETTTVTANTSTDNGNLGVDAVPGVHDGGGNVAVRNGSAVQCVNVVCGGGPPAVDRLTYVVAGAGDVQSVWRATGRSTSQRTAPGAYCCLDRVDPRDHDRVLVMPGGDPGTPVTGDVLDLTTGTATRLPLRDASLNLVPQAWSPDGAHIAFEGWDEADPSRTGVYTARAVDGGDLRRVTVRTGGPHDIPLDFSPDGARLVFYRAATVDSDLGGALWVVGVDGTGAHALTTAAMPPAPWARWSPDGRAILFATERLRPTGSVWAVRPDGSGARVVFHDPHGRFPITPAWSPDGRRVVFALDPVNDEFTHPDNELDVIDADGGNLRLLLGSHDFKRWPEWTR